MKVSVIIPAFDEEKTLGGVLADTLTLDLPDAELEVIVSDDGSSDRTSEIAEASADRDPRVRIIRSAANCGKTEAIRRALEIASGDVALIQDADHEYSPGDIPKLLLPFQDPSVQAVFGSRFLERQRPAGMTIHNWLANRLFTLVANLLFGGSLTDEGTALKAVRRKLLQSLDLESQRFCFCPEVTAKLLERKIRILEVPVSYHARSPGEGKKPGLLDGLEILWTLVKIRLTRRVGRG